MNSCMRLYEVCRAGKDCQGFNYFSHITQSERSGYLLTTPVTRFRKSTSGRLGSGQFNRWKDSPLRASASKLVPCPERMQGPGALGSYFSGCRTAFDNKISVFLVEIAHPISGQYRASSTYGRNRFPAAAGTCRDWRSQEGGPPEKRVCFLNSKKNERQRETSRKAPYRRND